MAESKGCWKFGCLGCGGLALVSIVGLAALAGVQTFNLRQPKNIEEFDVERTLPPSAYETSAFETSASESRRTRVDAEGGTAGEASALAPSATEGELRLWLSQLQEDQLSELAVGRIHLDISLADFEIRAGEPGSSVSIEAEYDPSDYELVEDYSEKPDGSWSYDVTFKGERTWFGMITSGASNNPGNRIVMRIPPDRLVHLSGDIGIAEAELDLGGLWLGDVELDTGVGEFVILVSRPTLVPMGRLTVDGGVGEVVLRDIGNASPSLVEVDLGVGELRADLSGAWSRDSKIRIDCGIGDCSLEVPDDVFVEIGRANVGMGDKSIRLPDQEDVPAGAPRLELDLSGGMGSLRVDD